MINFILFLLIFNCLLATVLMVAALFVGIKAYRTLKDTPFWPF